MSQYTIEGWVPASGIVKVPTGAVVTDLRVEGASVSFTAGEGYVEPAQQYIGKKFQADVQEGTATTPGVDPQMATAISGAAQGYPTPDFVPNAAHGWWVYPIIQETDEYVYTSFAADKAFGAHGVARVHKGSGAVTRSLIGFVDGEDDHNVPAILLQPDETLLIAYSAHATENKLYVARTAGRNSLEIAHRQELATSAPATYAQLLRPTSGSHARNVFLFYRVGSSHAGTWCVRVSANNGRTWGAERSLITAPYCRFSYDLNNSGSRLRVLCYPNPGTPETTHSVYYALLETDGNGEIRIPGPGAIANTGWLGGSTSALPVDFTTLFLAVNIGSVPATLNFRMFDSRRLDLNTSSTTGGNPTGNVAGLECVLGVEFPDPGGALTAGVLCRYLYQGSGSVFQRKVVLANVGEPFFGSYYNGACFDRNSIDTVYAIRNPSNKNSEHELVRLRTTNAGDSWTETVIYRSPYRIARPSMLSDGRIMLTEFVAPYNNWDDWNSNGIRILAV